MMTKKILNTKLKDIIKYCDNNLCADKCPFEKICIYHSAFEKTDYTLVSMMSSLVDREIYDD